MLVESQRWWGCSFKQDLLVYPKNLSFIIVIVRNNITVFFAIIGTIIIITIFIENGINFGIFPRLSPSKVNDWL